MNITSTRIIKRFRKKRRERSAAPSRGEGQNFSFNGHNTQPRAFVLVTLFFLKKKISYITPGSLRRCASQNGGHFFLLFSTSCLSFSVKNAIVISVPVRVCVSVLSCKDNCQRVRARFSLLFALQQRELTFIFTWRFSSLTPSGWRKKK